MFLLTFFEAFLKISEQRFAIYQTFTTVPRGGKHSLPCLDVLLFLNKHILRLNSFVLFLLTNGNLHTLLLLFLRLY
jgi:hypothetical protein